MIKIIGLRYGHSVNCRGARGIIDEVDSCRILYNKIKALLESLGYIVVDCNSNANNEDDELSEGTNKANNAKVDIYITLHMNSATNLNARGVECWVYDTKSKTAITIGNKICSNIANLGTPNRGVKYGGLNYHDVSASNMEAIIVESIFVGNQLDSNIFKNKTDELARAIANGIDSRVGLSASFTAEQKPQIEMHRNIIVYNNGAEADKACAEYFAMILNSKNEDCVAISYEEYRKSLVDGRSIFAVGGSLEGKFRYHKLFSGKDRNETASLILEHLK